MKRLVKCLMLFIVLSILILNIYSQDVDDELSREIKAMAKIGMCYSPEFSPQGNEIAFISNISGSPQIWKVPSDGGWPIQLTAFDDPVTGFQWSPTGDWIAFQLAPGGGLNSQIYLMKPDGTKIQRITTGGKTNNWLGVWSKDGNYLTYSSNLRILRAMDCYYYDLKNKESKLIAKNQGIGFITDISHDNNLFLLNRLVSRGSNDLFLIDRVNSRETLLTAHKGPGSFWGKFRPHRLQVYLASNKDRDLIAFGTVTPDNKIKILFERQNSELASFTFNHSGSKAILVWNLGGKNEITFFDLEQNTAKNGPDLPVELISSLSFSKNDKYVVFTGNGSKEPLNIWVLDTEKNTFKKITESPHPGINLNQLISPELVTFNSFDGLGLSGWLYQPKLGSKPYPTVISFHGGPEGQARPVFSPNAQALLSRGIAVFRPNVRGSWGFGKKFVNLDNGKLRFNGIKDIKSCVDYVIHSGFADKNKIGIMGGSYGGYMVMAGITEYPDMFAAAANLFGIVNFHTFFANTQPWMAEISKVEYGDPETESQLLKDLSPLHKLDRVKTATIVLHGANDTNVPVVEAEQVVNHLKKRNVPVKYILFPDEGHGWRKTHNKIKSTIEIVKWFETYLK